MLDLKNFQDFMNESRGFNRHNNIRFTVVENEYCECELDVTPEALNPQGFVHGSLLFALCDCVTGVATASTDRSMLTLSANIQYVRPGTGKKLLAKSRMIHNGRKTALCVGEVFDEQGRLLVTSQFEVFYTTDHLNLPVKGEDGVWRAAEGDDAWNA